MTTRRRASHVPGLSRVPLFLLVLAGLPILAAEPEAPIADSGPALSATAQGHGGVEALRAFPGFFARGMYVNADDGRGGDIEVSIFLDGSMRWEKSHSDRGEIRILAGPLAWSGGNQRQRVAPRELADAIRIQYHMFAAPFELAREDPLSFQSDGESPERWTRIVRAWNENLSTAYEVDAESGLVRRVIGRRGTGDDMHTIVTELNDFRDVAASTGNVRLPFRMTTRVDDEVIGEMRWNRIVMRDSFAPETFLPHDAAGDF